MKNKFLSILLTIGILCSLFSLNGLAVTEIRTVTFRNVPYMFVQNMDMDCFVPGSPDANRGYDYFWLVEKYDTSNNYVASYWPESMDDLALRFYQMLVPSITMNQLAEIKEPFGTAFDGDYVYVFMGIAMLNSGYVFSDSFGINLFLSDGSSQSFVQDNGAQSDYAYIAYNMPQLGDLNYNKSVDASDALIVLQNSVGKSEFTSGQTMLADVDETVGVSPSDTLQILQMSVGKISSFTKYQQ